MIRSATIALAGGAALLAAAAFAQPAAIELPLGDTPPELADAASEVVVNKCSACHSLDYITTQPRGKGEQFWRDAVAKMINVYKAPISPEDADAVGAELARKFG
jgi:sulfite dehydrogenase (cytochrome) subunit B